MGEREVDKGKTVEKNKNVNKKHLKSTIYRQVWKSVKSRE